MVSEKLRFANFYEHTFITTFILLILFTRTWNREPNADKWADPLCMRGGTLITIRPYWY